jgi:Uma2 family endonuclease
MSTDIARKRMRIDVNRYQKMVAAGVLTREDKIELIDGEMLEMAPIGMKHVYLLSRLTKLFVFGVGDAGVVVPGCPVDVNEFSEPEPDLCVLRPPTDRYAAKHARAADVLLLIEVSDSSLAFDLSIKRALYARAAIPEYWIADVPGKLLRVFREPQGDDYLQQDLVAGGRVARPLALPDIAVEVAALFP